jgi:hypothetical protein
MDETVDQSIDLARKDELLVCTNGERSEFEVDGHRCFWIRPKAEIAPHKPWVWYAPTFVPRLPKHLHRWYISRLLASGIHVAGVDVGESWGNPEGRKVYTAFHDYMTGDAGFEYRACLWPQSRGGMMAYNWAVEHPERVKCIAGIYTVVTAVEPLKQRVYDAFGLTAEEFAAQKEKHNPVDRIGSLAKAGVPIFHIHGDVDTRVPFEANAGELVRRYRAAGGTAELEVVPGKGHEEVIEFFTSEAFIEWLIRQALDTIGHL